MATSRFTHSTGIVKSLAAAALLIAGIGGSAHADCAGEVIPMTCAQRALAYEAAQDDMDRRAEIRSHHPQPHETVITQRLDPAANPVTAPKATGPAMARR